MRLLWLSEQDVGGLIFGNVASYCMAGGFL